MTSKPATTGKMFSIHTPAGATDIEQSLGKEGHSQWHGNCAKLDRGIA
jgi:hypothetical protein